MNSPLEVTNYKRTQAELEAFWLFCLFVQGRNSDFGFRCMRRMVDSIERDGKTSFERIREEMQFNRNYLHNLLVANKVGQYYRFATAIEQSLALNLRTASLEDLLQIFGIGPKTARFFLVHSRGEEYAILDVHILRWMRQFDENVPTSTPSIEKVYLKYEERFLSLAKMQFPQARDIAEIDLLIWAQMSGRI